MLVAPWSRHGLFSSPALRGEQELEAYICQRRRRCYGGSGHRLVPVSNPSGIKFVVSNHLNHVCIVLYTAARRCLGGERLFSLGRFFFRSVVLFLRRWKQRHIGPTMSKRQPRCCYNTCARFFVLLSMTCRTIDHRSSPVAKRFGAKKEGYELIKAARDKRGQGRVAE